jgi:adenosylcobyric acid synthase
MAKQAKTLMVMGTSSSAGKSLLVTALCRCFARRGVRVAPFKSQNMSNNAAVCSDGAEIGRSQALQAFAAHVLPHSDMNPILLKPEGATHSQVIVNGRPLPEHQGRSLEASDYFQRRHELWGFVTSALDRMRDQYDLIIIEGAGSPAELNLSNVEMVNMSVARYCNAAVILVGDIERGGVFAQLLGTLWLLPENDRKLIRGLIVNKFRGDLRLFDRGVEILEERGQVPVLGVLPWIDALKLPEEDAVALFDGNGNEKSASHSSADTATETSSRHLDIAVIHVPHIANFDDFDPLNNEPSVRLRYIRSLERLGNPDVIVLPGTKNTLGDLHWLKSSGLADRIIQLAKTGTRIVGICGGYQMLGKHLSNPHSMENNWMEAEGLGLLDVTTIFHREKQTFQVEAMIEDGSIAAKTQGERVHGYEIHVGQTTSSSPWLRRIRTGDQAVESATRESSSFEALDGAKSDDHRIWGCYLHGLFHNDTFRRGWLSSLGVEPRACDDPNQLSYHAVINESLDRLADAFEANIDFTRVEQLVMNSEMEPK